LKAEIPLRRAAEQEADRRREEEEERKRKAEETRKRKEAAEKKWKEEEEAEIRRRLGQCEYFTFRYPDSPELRSVSLLSHTAEIEGKELRLDQAKKEWTMRLLISAGPHRFRFLVNGKDKRVSSLHEKDRLGVLHAWKNTCPVVSVNVPISFLLQLLSVFHTPPPLQPSS
jgi:hypothetical protein